MENQSLRDYVRIVVMSIIIGMAAYSINTKHILRGVLLGIAALAVPYTIRLYEWLVSKRWELGPGPTMIPEYLQN